MKDENGLDIVEKETVQYIVVSIGNEQYGLDISYVDNIVRMCKITRVPKAPSHYIGVINLRGEIVPLMSLRRKMNLEDDVFTDITRYHFKDGRTRTGWCCCRRSQRSYCTC